jgi:hypothetical protein
MAIKGPNANHTITGSVKLQSGQNPVTKESNRGTFVTQARKKPQPRSLFPQQTKLLERLLRLLLTYLEGSPLPPDPPALTLVSSGAP